MNTGIILIAIAMTIGISECQNTTTAYPTVSNCTITCTGGYGECIRGNTNNAVLCGCLQQRYYCDINNDLWNGFIWITVVYDIDKFDYPHCYIDLVKNDYQFQYQL